MKDRYIYPAIFEYEAGHEIAVLFPDLDTATSGMDEEDALNSARELLGLVIYGLEEDGELIPTPSKLKKINCNANQKVVLIDIYMHPVRNEIIDLTVEKTFGTYGFEIKILFS